MSEEQFWRLDPRGPLWWLIDAKRPRKMYGRLTEAEVDSMVEELKAERTAQQRLKKRAR